MTANGRAQGPPLRLPNSGEECFHRNRRLAGAGFDLPISFPQFVEKLLECFEVKLSHLIEEHLKAKRRNPDRPSDVVAASPTRQNFLCLPNPLKLPMDEPNGTDHITA